jgi:hypothetical protein
MSVAAVDGASPHGEVVEYYFVLVVTHGYDPSILKYIRIIDPNNDEWKMNMMYHTPEDLNI